MWLDVVVWGGCVRLLDRNGSYVPGVIILPVDWDIQWLIPTLLSLCVVFVCRTRRRWCCIDWLIGRFSEPACCL